MTGTATIKTLFDRDIDRRIEEVIKVDQVAEEVLREEIDEYVTTATIGRHYTEIFERYADTPNHPHEGIAIWVSGFFGSGKSSFAKILGLAIENRQVLGESAALLFGRRTGNPLLQVNLERINRSIPTHAVIFDVSTDRGIRSGNQMLTEIMYGLFLQSLGYAKDLDLSELEIGLEEKGELARFEDEYRRLYPGKEWAAEKGKVAFALGEASRVMHHLDPDTWPLADSWVKAVKNKADISPGRFAERASELMNRRRPGHSLLFVVDEVGQFVARDVQKMLDLQAVVQNLAIKGRGKHWLVVTSQEKLGELVSGLDDKKIELARLMDRFPLQVHLESSDISEVTSRRVLAKNAAGQAVLGKLYEEHRGRLGENTRLSAEIRLPELTRDSFVDLYPLLPYQIELIIQIVSGLRTQGGSSKHVGGANRTIIKLAQQLLIHQGVHLADEPVGALARVDQVYDLVESNIGSEVRAKIAGIAKELRHPLAQSVAKVICLLQQVKSVHRTAENFAAALYPGVGADSQLAAVREALVELERTQKVRRGDDGYRIPTPAEDDWERQRMAIDVKPGDRHRIHQEALVTFWQPQPSFTLFDTKTFKAGLAIQGREVIAGDMVFHLELSEEGEEHKVTTAALRARSQQERKQVFWAIALSGAIDRETVELHRSREMLARKERDTQGEDSPGLIAEERQRRNRHQAELTRLLKLACLAGSVFFRGQDRGPSDRVAEVGKAVTEILGKVLPDVFDRFQEAAAKAAEVKKGTDALFVAENLQGLPPVFSSLGLLRDEKGKAVFRVESGPLKVVLDRIEERANYGDTASGRLLADEFEKEPFGWEFDVVRLLVLSLVRAGKVEAISKGQTFDTVTGIEARDAFSNNNVFRSASFRPKKGIEFEELVRASEAFRDTFGSEVRELNAGAIAGELRREVGRLEDQVAGALAVLTARNLPGREVLEGALGQMKAIQRGTEDNALATFNASHRSLKDAIRRAAELEQNLTEPRLYELEKARRILATAWPFLEHEPEVAEEVRASAWRLEDLLARETFYKELPSIEQSARLLDFAYQGLYEVAVSERLAAYEDAFDKLVKAAGWNELDEDQRARLAGPFERGRQRPGESLPIPQLRSERDACEGRLRAALQELRRIIDGERVVALSFGSYFGDGVETEEQLDEALKGVREECARLIGAGKKVIVQ